MGRSMRLFLVSDSKTGVNFFPQLVELLGKKVADLRTETIFVPFPEDIPARVAAVAKEADLIFVFVLYEEKDFKIEALLNKLIDIETRTKAKIVKVIEESDVDGMNELQLEKEREVLAEKWGQFILDYVFNPARFKPGNRKGEDFSPF